MEKLKQHIASFLQPYADQKLIVACSGGVDSMVLLYSLHNLGYSVATAHVNYHLRGEDSIEDEGFIRQFCKENHIDFFVQQSDLPVQLIDGGNLQELARVERYDFFKKLLAQHQGSYVLLAHHLDDQIETFYLNLARNSGVMGLACIPEKREQFLRPLLPFAKKELIDFARDNNIQWREDASNKTLKYNRNKLRNEVLPFLTKELPELKESVQVLIHQFQQYQLELETKIALLVNYIHDSNFLFEQDWKLLNEFEKIELMRQLQIPFTAVEELEQLSQVGTKYLLKNSHWTSIIKSRKGFDFLLDEIVVDLPGLIIEEVNQLPTSYNLDEIYLNESKVIGPLKLRPWQEGDRIKPIGMNGSQLVSDIIQQAKLSTQEKRNVLVLTDEQEIHWVVGLKVARIANAKTTPCLKIRLR